MTVDTWNRMLATMFLLGVFGCVAGFVALITYHPRAGNRSNIDTFAYLAIAMVCASGLVTTAIIAMVRVAAG